MPVSRKQRRAADLSDVHHLHMREALLHSEKAARGERAILLLLTVTLIALAGCVWQATRYEDEAIDRYNEARVAAADKDVNGRVLQALVAQDLRLYERSCAARQAASASQHNFLDADSFRDRAPFLTSQIQASLLPSLTQSDLTVLPCGAPSNSKITSTYVRRAADLQALQTARHLTPRPDPDRLQREASGANEKAPRFFWAAVLFALAFVALTLSDRFDTEKSERDESQLASGWRVVFLVCGVGLFLTASVFVAIQRPQFSTLEWVFLAAVVLAAALPLLIRHVPPRVRLVQRRAKHSEGTSDEDAPDEPARGSADRVERLSKVLAALTLFALAWATLGWGRSLADERKAAATAARTESAAEVVLATRLDAALSDRETVADVVDLRATSAVDAQSPDPFDKLAVPGIDQHVTELERRARNGASVRDALESTLTPDKSCPSEPNPNVDIDAFLQQWSDNDAAFQQHVVASSHAGVVCQALAAMSRDDAASARKWATRDALAFIVLGVVLLLFALAIEGKHHTEIRWCLFGAATLGLFLGVYFSVDANINRDKPKTRVTDAHAVDFARELAAGRLASLEGECRDALRHADTAVRMSDRVPRSQRAQAYLERAAARACSSDANLLSSAMDAEALKGFVTDLQGANGSGVPVNGDMGWARLLEALDARGGRRATLLREGLDETEHAIDIIRDEKRTEPVVHLLRFNTALAALAANDSHARAIYSEAFHCLNSGAPSARCPGGGLSWPSLRNFVTLSALEDIELLGPRAEYNAYRELLVGLVNPAADTGPTRLSGLKLVVQPQQLIVESPPSKAAEDVSTVFYFRASPDDDWAVLISPSVATMSTGAWLNLPLPASAELRAGEYRADVYEGGRLAARLTTKGGVTGAFHRVAFADLGVSVVVPESWHRLKGTFARHVEYGPGGKPALWIDAEEGVQPTGAVGPWLGQHLDGLVRGKGTPVTGALLGLPVEQLRRYTTPDRGAAIGFSPYVARDAACGGAAVSLEVARPSSAEAQTVLQSVQVDARPHLSVRAGRVRTDGFSLLLPRGWYGVEYADPNTNGPGFFARPCSATMNLVTSVELVPASTSLQALSGQLLQSLQGGFSDFALLHRTGISLADGSPAVELDYTIDADRRTEQRMLVALHGDKEFTLVVSTRVEDAGSPIVEGILRSFALDHQ